MSDVASILEGVDPQSFARLERSIRRTRRAVVIESGVVFVILLGAGSWAIWQAWQTGNWFLAWVAPFFALFELLTLALPTTNMLPALRHDGVVAQALRRAAASGDERLAPLATAQPGGAPGGLQDAYMAQSLQIQSASGSRRLSALQFLYVIPVIYVVVLPQLFFISFSTVIDNAIAYTNWTYVFFGALFVVTIGASIWRASRLRLTATADDLGVAWQRNGAQYRIAWSEARAFFIVRYTPAGGSFPRAAYVLDGGEAVLMWYTPFVMRGKRQVEMERFLATLTTRAGKPLRDLSSLASSLAITTGKPPRLRALGVPTEMLGLPEDLAAPSRWRWRPSRGGIALATVALAPLVALSGAGIWLYQYQPTYQAGLPAQVHGERPLYSDALTVDDGAWRPAAGQFGGHGQFVFADGTYQLSDPFAAEAGDTTSISAWAPGEYSDAAVEVTASQSGGTADDGVGIVARADASGNVQLSFTVDTVGDWNFSECDDGADWFPLDSGQSGAAKIGQSVPNTLLLIMRGPAYLYYLNGKLVGSYTDDFSPTPHSGRVGVVVMDGMTGGAFSDFAVYPAPQPSSFLWF